MHCVHKKPDTASTAVAGWLCSSCICIYKYVSQPTAGAMYYTGLWLKILSVTESEFRLPFQMVIKIKNQIRYLYLKRVSSYLSGGCSWLARLICIVFVKSPILHSWSYGSCILRYCRVDNVFWWRLFQLQGGSVSLLNWYTYIQIVKLVWSENKSGWWSL